MEVTKTSPDLKTDGSFIWFSEIWCGISIFLLSFLSKVATSGWSVPKWAPTGQGMGEAEPHDWRCHSGTMPDSSYGEFVSLAPRSFQQKAGFWKSYATLLLLEKPCFPMTFLIRLVLEHSISINSYHSTSRREDLVSVNVVDPPCHFNFNCQIPAWSASPYRPSSPKACLPARLQ